MAYTYEPLPQNSHTRVLELSPALDPDAPLHGNVRFVDLDKGPFYDAISYTWGEPRFTEEIVIGENSRLHITPNLRDALIRYRQPTEIRSVWADAICIDQANEGDKRRQIQSMGGIFRCASSVLVWLGKEPWGEACLRKISLLSQRKTAPTTSDKNEISSVLSQLVSFSWFTRRWVVQELALNPHVVFFCGAISIPWLRVAQLLKIFPKEDLSPHVLRLYTLKETWDLHNHPRLPTPFEYEGKTAGILRLLSNFRETDCSDPRDRIYALLGLASDVVFEDYETRRKEAKVLIRIDYTQSVKQVYHDFALAVQQSGGMGSFSRKDLLFLEAARRFNFTHMSEWAPWVPDWRLPIVPFRSIRPVTSSIPGALHSDMRISGTAYFHGEIADVISVPYPKNADRSAKLEWLHDATTLIKKRSKDNLKGLLMDLLEANNLWHLLASTLMLKVYDREVSLRDRRYDDENAVLEALELETPPSVIENCCLFNISYNGKRDTLPVLGIGPRHLRSGDTVVCDGYYNYLIVLREADGPQSTVKHLEMEQDWLLGGRACTFIGFAFIPINPSPRWLEDWT
ncbi:heterokaryon incompatibility protein-domain-containing protein [Xylaria scruposa]|nr:heterokaryon incompatibility protein-domain-containing protein [Xylaria scruposa]